MSECDYMDIMKDQVPSNQEATIQDLAMSIYLPGKPWIADQGSNPNNPGKFDSVFVDKIRERQAIILAESSKKPAMTLLNSILGCVFKDEELASSSGLGLRKSGDDKKPPIN
uniref:Uncharacterized protein n=1 Tax=Magallana gigas TaxID=29159 RepID=K1PT12_MAGGI